MEVVKTRAYMREAQRKWRERHPKTHMWRAARLRARERGLKFTITPSDIIIPKRCPIFGTPLRRRLGRGRLMRTRNACPSLDRIDNKRGYIPGNVAVISWRANRLKGDATLTELERLVKYMRSE